MKAIISRRMMQGQRRFWNGNMQRVESVNTCPRRNWRDDVDKAIEYREREKLI
jgi:hypothetical protein